MAKKGEKKKGQRRNLLFVLGAVGVLVISLGNLISIYRGYRSEDKVNKKLEAAYVTYEEEEEIQGQGVWSSYEGYPALTVDMEALRRENPDTVGWLYWKLFDLSYPVVQGSDNEAYIRTSFWGEPARSGTIFLDSRCAEDLSDWHSVIYGHDMKDQSMFGRLKEMHEGVDVNEEPYFYIYTDQAVYRYKIFGYAVVSPEDELYDPIQSGKEYDAFIDRVHTLSDYSVGVEPDWSTKPRVMLLSTCYQRTKRTLVAGYLDRTFETKSPCTPSVENLEELAIREKRPDDADRVYFDDQAIALAEAAVDPELAAKFLEQARLAFDQVNEIREENGLDALTWSSDLESAALVRAREATDVWSHTRPDGSQWWTVDSTCMYGENLARGYSDGSAAVEGWMDSVTHKENLLKSDYKTMGISVVMGTDGRWYWAQEFGY